MSDDAHDLGAEQAMLGSVLANSDVAGPALLALNSDAWYRPRHAEIAAVLTDRLRRNEPIDPQLILTELLTRQGFGAEIGPYLLTLVERAWNTAHAADYAERILRLSSRRNLAAAGLRLRQQLDQSWLNGWDEPITHFTNELREVCDAADLADAGIGQDVPSPTLADLLAGEDAHDWLVPGLLARGERMILTGGEGLGKSFLACQVAVCLAAGRHPFTGNLLGGGDRQLRVLVVDCENGVNQSRRRFRRIVSRIDAEDAWGRQPSLKWRQNLHLEIRPNGLDLLGPDSAWLESRVAANAPDLLVLGPLYRLHLANMNDELAARGLVRVIDSLRTRHGCAVLSEAHAGHSEDGAGNRRMRPAGSSLFLRWPEFGFGLAKAKGAEGEHPSLVDVVAWRGSREERQWPRQLKHGSFLPWEPAHQDYLEEAA